MGERYTITALGSRLEERFEIEIPGSYQPRYNAGPTQLLPIITQESKGLSFFYWGQIPNWSKNKSLSKKLLYAEKEELALKPSLKTALKGRRCIIPIDGYYEWKPITKKGKVAHRIVFNSNEIVAMAGLWEEFEDPAGETAHTFKILTCTSNELVSTMNPRMPVVLSKEVEKYWLSNSTDTDELIEKLNKPHDYIMSTYSVSPKIEDLSIDSEKLIAPFAPADQFGNYSLFD